jgi:transposase, IS6 family
VSQKRPTLFRGRHFQDVIIFVGALVSALLAQLPRLGGNDGIARSDRGSRHHLALGPALRAHFESAPWERTASESILAGGRNLRASRGKLGVPVSRRGFGWDTIHFMLSPNRDLVAAKHLLQLALHRTGRVRPRVINVDGHLAYATAISELAGSRRAMWSGKSGSSTRYTESLPNMLALGIRALPLKFAVCNTSEIITCERNNAPSSAYL